MKAKIVPHLWFDDQAADAARFYGSVFPESAVGSLMTLPADTPSGPEGSVQVVDFTVFRQPFVAFNAGPLFKPTPALSFIVNFDPLFFGAAATREQEARRKLDAAWERLADGGEALMEIGEYPFSKRYGWIKDKYGFSWQLMLTSSEGDPRPPVMPSLLFTGKKAGKAEEAIDFYVAVFRNAKRGDTNRYGPGQGPEKEGSLMFADCVLEHQWFAAMDSAHEGHVFDFTEAVSLMVQCKDQQEIDYYWGKLSAVKEAEQCGWLKDKYGVSWQITPTRFAELMSDPDKAKARRVTEAMLQMKKFDIKGLERAYGEPQMAGR